MGVEVLDLSLLYIQTKGGDGDPGQVTSCYTMSKATLAAGSSSEAEPPSFFAAGTSA